MDGTLPTNRYFGAGIFEEKLNRKGENEGFNLFNLNCYCFKCQSNEIFGCSFYDSKSYYLLIFLVPTGTFADG